MKKILLIEDNQSIRSLITIALEESGYDVTTSDNGSDALEQLMNTQQLPSLIILDLMMPVMNGFEFRKTQLQNAKLARIPVILLTANNRFQDQKEVLQAHEFLNKPVDLKDLLYIIENFFFINSRTTLSL